MDNKSFIKFLESYSAGADVNQLIGLIGSMGSELRSAGQAVTELANSGHEERVVKSRWGMILARWFNTYYLSELEPTIRNLHVDDVVNGVEIHADKELRASGTVMTASSNFELIVDQLPRYAMGISESLDNAIRRLVRTKNIAIDQLKRAIETVRSHQSEDDSLQSRNRNAQQKYKQTIGQQRNQAEEIVQQIIKSLPADLQPIIRHSISRSSDRLNDLLRELQDRGIKAG